MLGIFFAGAAVITMMQSKLLELLCHQIEGGLVETLAAASIILVGTITWDGFRTTVIYLWPSHDIPYTPIQWYHVLAPATLLVLTRAGIPVSTTFLVLSVFSTGVVFENACQKHVGHAVAACGIRLLAGFGKLYGRKKESSKHQSNIGRQHSGSQLVFGLLG